MKQNWTYKKLGEVGTVIGGSTPKTDVAEFWNGDFAWITPAELDGSKYIHSTVRTITKEAIEKTNLTLLPVGTVLLSSRAPIGKVCITTIPMYCNQGFKNIVCSDKLNNEFLYWWLKGKNDYLNSLGVGATFKEISKRIVEQIIIPVPPIETQSRIVSELNLLQSIIDKQQAQLKELDKLAQAVFYDMFGDPVENEKGWEVIEMGELFEIGSSKRVFEAQWTESGVPFYRAREIVKLSKNEPIDSPIFISEELYQEYSKKYGVPSAGDMMVTAVGTLGVTYIVKASDKFYFKDGNTLWFKSKGLCETRFIRDEYSTDYVIRQIQGNANAAVVGTYTIMNAKKTKVVVPPISLQKKYVAIVESIEKQKAAIRQSIAETQKLFDYTMDKYFG
jgi:type I restriction enzyme S subunit